MTEEIIKALECCQVTKDNECKDCPYYNESDNYLDCLSKLCADTLALINQQKAKIEDLKDINEHLNVFVLEAREATIKEFAEGLREKLYGFPTVYNSAFSRMIDNLVKEMKGG